MNATLLLLAVFTIAVHCRVTFERAELIEWTDILGKQYTDFNFACSTGCRAYANSNDTTNTGLVIVRVVSGAEITEVSMETVLNSKNDDTSLKGVSLVASDTYRLKNNNANPHLVSPFVLYIAQNGAPNLGAVVVGVNSTGIKMIFAGRDNQLLTVLNPFESFTLNHINSSTPDRIRLYTTGFDSVSDAATPIFSPQPSINPVRNSFGIYSPLLTVNFGKNSIDNWLVVDGTTDAHYEGQKMTVGDTKIMVSPGFIGTATTNNALKYYYSISSLTKRFKSDSGKSFEWSVTGGLHEETVTVTDAKGNTKVTESNLAATFIGDSISLDWTRKSESGYFHLEITAVKESSGTLSSSTENPEPTTNNSASLAMGSIFILAIFRLIMNL